MNSQDKLDALKGRLKELGDLCIAFSGGVDSTFLLDVAHEVLGDRVMAVTVRGSMNPQRELEEAKSLAEKVGVRHVIVDAGEFGIPGFIDNLKDRCYHCKKAVFSKIKDIAAEKGIGNVADGSNSDDENDFRPGGKATKELKVISPLKDAGLSKQNIRELSKGRRLPTWDKPSFACLASRIPYGDKITREKLKVVEDGEELLLKAGFKQFRLRHHGEIARVEVLPEEIDRLLDPHLREEICASLKEIGFKYVTLDLEGYRSGSMNEVLS